jgi:glc operon protein GlcG
MNKLSRWLVRIVALAAAIMMADGASAQTGSAASPMQDFKSLTGTAARAMVEACRVFAVKNNLRVTIVVVDAHGDLLDFHRMDGAHVIAAQTAPLKAKTAVRWRLPSQAVAERVAQGNNTALWLGDFPQRGGLPVMVDGGRAAGAIGVGGAPSEQDEQCAQVGIDAVLGGLTAR